MFGSHKRKGKEVGLAVRNSFASVCIGTSLYDPSVGFRPSAGFFMEPYVLGYSLSSMNMFKNYMLNGSKWSATKNGEYLISAFAELQRDIDPWGMGEINNAIMKVKGDKNFEKGMADAELNFAAMFDMISASSANPVVVEARKRSVSLQDVSSAFVGADPDPNSGFKIAVAQLTIAERLKEMFP